MVWRGGVLCASAASRYPSPAAHDIRMRYLSKVCAGAVSGAALLSLCVPESALDTTLGPALVAACAWAAAGPLSSAQGRARAATGCCGLASQLRAAAVALSSSQSREGVARAARAAAAATASEQLSGSASATLPVGALGVSPGASGGSAAAAVPPVTSAAGSRWQAAGGELV